MGSIAYTAARALTGGALVGDPITRDVRFRSAVRRTAIIKKRKVALAGNEETVLQRFDTLFSVTTANHAEAERAELDMWIRSVAAGELFTIDFVGTIAVPVTTRSVRMLSTSIVETGIGRGYFRYSFDLIEP